jgi:hypothetical protein
VVDTYDGSLKAEHGTGRNMAPFVRKEWGESAFQVMKQIKALFDPDNILNRASFSTTILNVTSKALNRSRFCIRLLINVLSAVFANRTVLHRAKRSAQDNALLSSVKYRD